MATVPARTDVDLAALAGENWSGVNVRVMIFFPTQIEWAPEGCGRFLEPIHSVGSFRLARLNSPRYSLQGLAHAGGAGQSPCYSGVPTIGHSTSFLRFGPCFVYLLAMRTNYGNNEIHVP